MSSADWSRLIFELQSHRRAHADLSNTYHRVGVIKDLGFVTAVMISLDQVVNMAATRRLRLSRDTRLFRSSGPKAILEFAGIISAVHLWQLLSGDYSHEAQDEADKHQRECGRYGRYVAEAEARRLLLPEESAQFLEDMKYILSKDDVDARFLTVAKSRVIHEKIGESYDAPNYLRYFGDLEMTEKHVRSDLENYYYRF